MSDHFVGTSAVQERHRFDAGALEDYLRSRVDGFRGPLEIEQFKGGQSNPTFLLKTPGARYVMRAKPGPAAKLLPSAHAVDREYRVITALGKAGMPVPRTFALCEDEGVIGRAFYVMDFMEGRVLWEQSLPDMEKAERSAILRSVCSRSPMRSSPPIARRREATMSVAGRSASSSRPVIPTI